MKIYNTSCNLILQTTNKSLVNANLCNADLRNANLRNADLRYANLRDADLSYAESNIISIIGLRWPIYITKNQMQIGCEIHTVDEWRNFTDSQITPMEDDALVFWHNNIKWLFALIDGRA